MWYLNVPLSINEKFYEYDVLICCEDVHQIVPVIDLVI